jgi:hypothetical protein
VNEPSSGFTLVTGFTDASPTSFVATAGPTLSNERPRPLDKAVDPKKNPDLHVFKSNEDGDTVCVIALDVPANNDYGKHATDGVAKYL